MKVKILFFILSKGTYLAHVQCVGEHQPAGIGFQRGEGEVDDLKVPASNIFDKGRVSLPKQINFF